MPKNANVKKGGYMSNTQLLFANEQQTITVQEYQEYKRSLLGLRRQYAELMHGNRFEKTEVYAQKLRELEQEIAETEERLANATLESPEVEPITLYEVIAALIASLKSAKDTLSAATISMRRWVHEANSKLSFGDSETKDTLI